MNTLHLLLLLLSTIIAIPVAAVGIPTEKEDVFNQHAPEELRDFAFWLGLWEFETQQQDAKGNTVKVSGTNRISVTFDGYGLHEDFNMGSGPSQFSGGSVTTMNPNTKEFVQVWTDNSGWHKTFIGKWNDEMQAMILYGPKEEKDGKAFQTRLVWKNIDESAMDWSYERTVDDGESWNSIWDIHYLKVKE